MPELFFGQWRLRGAIYLIQKRESLSKDHTGITIPKKGQDGHPI